MSGEYEFEPIRGLPGVPPAEPESEVLGVDPAEPRSLPPLPPLPAVTPLFLDGSRRSRETSAREAQC